MEGTDDIDLSEFEAQRGGSGPRCTMSRLGLDPEQQAKLTAALASTLPSSAISKVLRAWGHHVGESTVSRHRRGLCCCGR